MNIIHNLRQYRVGEFAVFDFAVSYLAMWFLAPLLSRLVRKVGFHVPRINWIFFTLPLAVAIHLAIGQSTPLTSQTMAPWAGYVAKGVVLLSLLLSFRGITRVTKAGRRQ